MLLRVLTTLPQRKKVIMRSKKDESVWARLPKWNVLLALFFMLAAAPSPFIEEYVWMRYFALVNMT